MDLAFTPEEEAFRQEVRAWVHANLPQELSHKVHNALRLTREDMQQWARILGKKNCQYRDILTSNSLNILADKLCR